MKQLDTKTMYKALLDRDSTFEGIFVVGVKTTGIFCRPTCRARKPKIENTEFFSTFKDAINKGYRPCKVCTPLSAAGSFPDWLQPVIDQIDGIESPRLNDASIRRQGIDPNRVRRWFQTNYKMTFQAYLRSLRVGQAFGYLNKGGKVTDAAFEHGYESLSGFTEAFKNLVGSSPRVGKTTDLIQVYQFLSPLGPMIAASTKEGICLLEFLDRRGLENEIKDLQNKLKRPIVTSMNTHLQKLKMQLEEYFAGKRKEFTLTLFTPGSGFQNKVWANLQKIPYGKTRSYMDQAITMGNKKLVRAVARANGQNRIAIVIPCHRVIGKNGEMVGYAGGIWRKQKLLELEQKK